VVLKAVGLPLDAVGLILGVDRVLDMCRTTLNVWGDCNAIAIVHRFAGGAADPGRAAAEGPRGPAG
jgi:Na+/H+-dicarboxylate symporter